MPPVKLTAIAMPKDALSAAPPADAGSDVGGGNVDHLVIKAADNGGYTVECFKKPGAGSENGSALDSFRPSVHAFANKDELMSYVDSSFPGSDTTKADEEAVEPPAPESSEPAAQEAADEGA
jgi:hypothetical protein